MWWTIVVWCIVVLVAGWGYERIRSASRQLSDTRRSLSLPPITRARSEEVLKRRLWVIVAVLGVVESMLIALLFST